MTILIKLLLYRYTIGHIVKISDFGLSRIRTDKNEVVHNYDFPLTYHFTADTDVVSYLLLHEALCS